MGATYRLAIEGWLPVTLNRLLGCHWGTRCRLKRADREVVGLCARAAGIPPAAVRRRVSLHFTLAPRQRAFDPDAPLKSLLDSLVACGLLVNDSPRWCELGPVTFARGRARKTEVVLEDLG